MINNQLFFNVIEEIKPDFNPKKKLENFKNKEKPGSKILVTTDVAEEGIDIPDCNLVIVYDKLTELK